MRGLDTASFNGTGSLSAYAFAAHVAFANFNGVGTLTVTATSIALAASAQFNGMGSLTLPLFGTVSLNGNGRMCVNSKVYKGSIGPVSNVFVFGPGPTEMAIA